MENQRSAKKNGYNSEMQMLENQYILEMKVTIAPDACFCNPFFLFLPKRNDTMTARLFSVFIALLLLVSCQSQAERQMNRAEALMTERPDSALALLRSIEPAMCPTKKEKARHALLTSMALDKNYIDVTDDSLINVAVSYYSRKRNPAGKMKAWYYQGIVLKNAGRYTSAILSLEKAEQLALKMDDAHMLGLIYRNIAELFNATYNDVAAIDYDTKALHAFEANGDTLYAIHILYSLAVDYFNEKESEKSIALLQKLRALDLEETFRHVCDLHYANNLTQERDSLDLAIALYRKTPLSLMHAMDYGYYANALHATGQKDSAWVWLEKGYRASPGKEATAALQYLHSLIAFQEKDFEQAYRLQNSALFTQDSLMGVLLQESLSNAQRDYYREEKRSLDQVVGLQRRTMLFGVLIALLSAALLLLWQQKEKSRRDLAAKEQMARLARLHEDALHDNAQLVGALTREKLMHLYHLSESYFEEDSFQKQSEAFSGFKQALREIRRDEGFFNTLIADLNTYCNGIMDKLNEQVPEIKGDNRRLIALMFAGLPNDWILILASKNSSSSLKTARSRFRQTIKNAAAADEALFLDMLETKKQPKAKTKS